MEIGKVAMAGLVAGLIIGVISSIIILAVDTLGFLTNTAGPFCANVAGSCCLTACLAPLIGFGTVLVGNTMNVVAFLIAGLATLVAGAYATNKLAKFTAASDMIVGGAVGGLIAGIMVAIGATIVTILYPLVSAAIQILFAMLGLAGGANVDWLGLAWNTIVTGLGWIVVATVVFFAMGIFLGLIGGVIGSFIFKAAGKEE